MSRKNLQCHTHCTDEEVVRRHQHRRNTARSMESESLLLDEEPCCAACREVFNVPLVLCCISCGSDFCTSCLSQFSRTCPFCLEKKTSLQQCTEHGVNLTLFCISEMCPICPICHLSEVHNHHSIYPLTDAVEDCKVGMNYFYTKTLLNS